MAEKAAAQSRRRIRWMLAAAALVAVLPTTLLEVGNAGCFALTGEITCRVETKLPLVALSFDDGPTEEGVDATLAALRAAGVEATFFLIGSEAEQRPHLVRRLAAAGHEIGNHSYSHAAMIGRRSSFYDAEIARTAAVLRAAGAPPTRLFRPPYGKKLFGLPLAVRRQGHWMVTWDVEEPNDGRSDAASYAAHIVGRARPGSIILIHPMYAREHRARSAIPLVIRGLQQRGFRIVTVGELLRHEAQAR
jgi:peptidoglycan/xylan/chitin deacetylase (PgdA/CDA1 family)